jgi:hypothetical protein
MAGDPILHATIPPWEALEEDDGGLQANPISLSQGL